MKIRLLAIVSFVLGWILVMSVQGADNFFQPDMEVKVHGLVCPSCAIGLKNAFKKHPDVSGLKMDTKKQILLLDFKNGNYIKNKEVIKMTEKAGYEVESIKILNNKKPNRYNKP